MSNTNEEQLISKVEIESATIRSIVSCILLLICILLSIHYIPISFDYINKIYDVKIAYMLTGCIIIVIAYIIIEWVTSIKSANVIHLYKSENKTYMSINGSPIDNIVGIEYKRGFFNHGTFYYTVIKTKNKGTEKEKTIKKHYTVISVEAPMTKYKEFTELVEQYHNA